jgi:hypothetical protein
MYGRVCIVRICVINYLFPLLLLLLLRLLQLQFAPGGPGACHSRPLPQSPIAASPIQSNPHPILACHPTNRLEGSVCV